MSINDTYLELILIKIINDLLVEGEIPTSSKIESVIDEYLTEYDFSKPLFKYDTTNIVSYNEVSSVLKQNNTYSTIKQDLLVLFKHLLQTTDQVILNFDRWREEAKLLESKLSTLEQRIDNLLLLTEDTSGYLNYIQDNFVDTSKIDLSNTTAYPNVNKNYIAIGTSSIGATKINLSNVKESDIEFASLIKTDFAGQVQVDRSQRRYIFDNCNNFWQERILYYKPQTVSAELKIKLSESNIQINKIDIDFHAANYSGYIDVLPMYSIDGSTWNQLPIDNYLQSVKDRALFQCTTVELKYLKLILTKTSYDNIINNRYAYEFGIDELSLYSESYTKDNEYIFISKPLYVNKSNNEPQEFTSVTLETCENVPENTKINYYLASSNDSELPLTNINWIPIDPLTRNNPQNPIYIDFSKTNTVEIENIGLSYDKSNNRSPSYTINLINSISGTTPTVVVETSTNKKYTLQDSQFAILDYQINENNIEILDKSIEIWRNVKNINSLLQVRNELNGWRFENPYYYTTVFVENVSGIEIDFGSKNIIIDNLPNQGKTIVEYGSHTIAVHKDNWDNIDLSSVTTIALLKAADKLYPYNHKLLVEGISYDSFTDNPTEQYYKGFDIVAEYKMKQISTIDMLNSTKQDDYDKFCIDYDAPHTSRTYATSVFLLRINPEYADFTNEEFLIKFKIAETQYKYLRLKAVLSTEDETISPYIDSYRIKLGN